MSSQDMCGASTTPPSKNLQHILKEIKFLFDENAQLKSELQRHSRLAEHYEKDRQQLIKEIALLRQAQNSSSKLPTTTARAIGLP